MGSVTTEHVKLYHNLTNGVKLKYEKNVNMAQFSASLDYDNRFPHFRQDHFPNPSEVGAAPKNSIGIIQYVNYTRFYSICQIKMQKRVIFLNDNRFSHFCQGHFPNPGEAGAVQKMADTSFNTFNYTRFAEFVKLKSKKNEKIPQFLEILTQRAVN